MFRKSLTAVRLFLSNRTDPSVDFEVHRKTLLVNILLLIGCSFLASLGILALLQHNSALAAADFSMLVFLLWMFLSMKQAGCLEPHLTAAIAVLGGFYIFLLANGGQNQTGFFWFYTYPLISIFLLGQRKGLILSIIAVSSTLGVFVLGGRCSLVHHYPLDFALRYIPSLLAVTLFAWAMERVRLYIQRQFENSNESLRISNFELEKTTMALREVSIKDALTDMFNRRHLDEVVPVVFDQCRRHNSTLALLMIDIDFFKDFNDTYGHLEGDKALVRVAGAFARAIRRNTDMVFRYGGEEFLVLLTKTTRVATSNIAERIMDEIETAAIAHRGGINGILSLSIGVAIAENSQSSDFKQLIQQADDALYAAKKQGRNRIHLSEQ